jgi:zinc-ribbon domain
MFCNRCGAQLQPEFNVCPKCGNPVTKTTNTGLVYRSRLERHLRPVGILWIIVGALWIIPSGVLMVLSRTPRLMAGDEMFGHMFMPPLFFSLGSVFLLVAVGGILVGWGLTHHERWARITAIVLAILALFHPPFFTALGIYTLWVLLPADSAAEYERLSRA